MSWKDNIDTSIEIETGDGKTYLPLYKIQGFEKEFNHSVFEFPELSGSLVDRRLPKGIKFSLTVYFQGENHIEDFKAFNTSSNDRRPWKIYHPIKGNILAQPIMMKDDSSGLGITTVEIDLITTIKKKPPRISKVPQDEIKFKTDNNGEAMGESFDERVGDMSPQNKDSLTSAVETVEENGEKLEKTQSQWDEFKNTVNTAKAEINNVIGEATSGINQTIAAISAPALFVDSVKERLANFEAQLDLLIANLGFLKTPEDKIVFETTGGAVINAMVTTLVNPISGDYNNAVDVVSVSQTMTTAYNNYVAALDEIQTDNGSDPDAYIPDYTNSAGIEDVVNLALSNLLDIALTGQLERRLILKEDSNPLSLAHRFYGMKREENLERFIDENNIGLNEILQLKKGREIVYYVG